MGSAQHRAAWRDIAQESCSGGLGCLSLLPGATNCFSLILPSLSATAFLHPEVFRLWGSMARFSFRLCLIISNSNEEMLGLLRYVMCLGRIVRQKVSIRTHICQLQTCTHAPCHAVLLAAPQKTSSFGTLVWSYPIRGWGDSSRGWRSKGGWLY